MLRIVLYAIWVSSVGLSIHFWNSASRFVIRLLFRLLSMTALTLIYFIFLPGAYLSTHLDDQKFRGRIFRCRKFRHQKFRHKKFRRRKFRRRKFRRRKFRRQEFRRQTFRHR